MTDDDLDTPMRMAALEHVRRLGEIHDNLTANELKPGFVFQRERIPLINPQRGIFKPKQMRFLLSIKTVFPSRVARFGTTISARRIGKFSRAMRRSTTPLWARTRMRPIIGGFAKRLRTGSQSSTSLA